MTKILPALLILTLLLSGCSRKEESGSAQAKRPPVPVVTATATTSDFTVTVQLMGTVEAVQSTPIKAQIGGQIVECLIRDGQRVKAGQELFRVDPRPLQGTVRQLEADRDRIEALALSAEAQVRALEAQAKTAAMQASAAEAASRTVETQAALAEAQYARYASLAEKEYVSREALDQVRTAADAAKSNLAASRAQADAAKLNAQAAAANVEVAKASVVSTRAQRASVEAGIDNAKLQLGYTVIRSPIDGQAGSLMAERGDYVKGNGDLTLVVVNQLTPVLARFAVPETLLPEVRKLNGSSPLKVSATLADGTRREGALTFIDNAVDRATGTVALKAAFANEDGALWPGQLLELTMELSTLRNVVSVPSPAVQNGQKGPYAYVVGADEAAAFRSVVPGLTQGGRTVVESGLKAGERVVVDGHLKITSGAKVAERPAPGSGSKPPAGERDKDASGKPKGEEVRK